MKVSILILTYNRLDIVKKYLPKIVQRNTEPDSEILIWDNGSTDGTAEWVYNYALQHPPGKIIFTRGAENHGMEAINFLAQMAKGEYVLKLDCDMHVPEGFVQDLIKAYEMVDDNLILFMGYDMSWLDENTFATRKGFTPFDPPNGRIEKVHDGVVLISHYPSKFMVNGACRLSTRIDFLKHGMHPKGAKYGIDYTVNVQAEKAGFYVAFYNNKTPVIHCNEKDTTEYRAFKDAELEKYSGPKDV